ncbi:MAG: metQ [Gammaproteobacteria bacterium]|jgi:D-methionine transport system substrate-binding protein|nr:metQ [Gammaproteobacteria bacterium]
MSNFALLSLTKALSETLYMVFISSIAGISLGLILGIILFFTQKSLNKRAQWLYQMLGFLVNVTRSVPFIILLIGIIPLTSLLIGTFIGTTAAIVPLTIAAIPFYARITESALFEVPLGLLEAAYAMGATRLQLIYKVLLPEAFPALMKGATLTMIGLIGYSAMAGAVGGGGLGELAINYGYQRFNTMVIVETVIVLVVLVQILQMIGDRIAASRHHYALLYFILLLGVISLLPFFFLSLHKTENTLRIGVISGVSEDVMQAAKEVAKNRYNLDLSMVTFNDYTLPNVALNDGKIEANIFQHQPYLDAQIQSRGFKLVTVAKTFVYPIGFYSRKIKQITQLKQKALIGISNDPSNQARALLLLQKAGLIGLKDKGSVTSTVQDIINNPKQLQFVTLDAAQLAHALSEVDLAAVNNDFLSSAGLTLSDAIIREDKDSPYANVMVVASRNQDAPWVQPLVEVMHSPEVNAATMQIYSKEGAIPAW